MYSIDIVREENNTQVVYFNSKIHVVKRKRIGPGYSGEFTHEEILRDILPYVIRHYGEDVTHCPHCGA
jgi:hypothetical protein